MSGSSSYGSWPQTAWTGRKMATQAKIFETRVRARQLDLTVWIVSVNIRSS